MKTLPGHITVLLLAFVVFVAILYGMDPPPQMWKTEEITILDIQYRSRPRTLSHYTSPGYEVIDQDGNLYWSGSELTWEKIGETYTIKYFNRGNYRRLRSVAQGDSIIISEAKRIAIWEQDIGFFLMLLFICLIVIIRQLRYLIRDLQHPEIQDCRKRIRIHEAKTNRCTLEKHRK